MSDRRTDEQAYIDEAVDALDREENWPWWEVTVEVPAVLRARVQAASKSAVRQAVIDGYIHDWSASYERDDNPDIIEIKRID